MAAGDLDAVTAIEACAYAYPWSRGNFSDSLAAGHECWLVPGATEGLLAYLVAMRGVDEWHLLNITVAPPHQGRGHGRALLHWLAGQAKAAAVGRLLLEVRPSNGRARQLYERCGFTLIGHRRGYYPALRGAREDALVMQWLLQEPAPDAL
jgi:[ribosomal protein S18]-alanine N-acetyltransferase